MRPTRVVVFRPFRDSVARMLEAEEQGLVQQIIRIRPLKDSTKPFCRGLPAAM